MDRLSKIVKKFDKFQRRNRFFGFAYAVIKKYGNDNGSYLSVLITYYLLLSLIPLLIIFTSLVKVVLKNNEKLQTRVTNSVYHYFPVIGNQLRETVHSKSGISIEIIISLLVLFYGVRGVANALQFSLSNVWKIPKIKRPPFIQNLSRSLSIMIIGGLGFVIASVLSTFVSITGKDFFTKILAIILSTLVIWLTLILVFKLSIAENKTVKDVILGAGLAAVGLQVLQSLGNIILIHELKNLNNNYGVFAWVVVLIFWLYLQAEVIIYSSEIQVVKKFKLFPRSLQGQPTKADYIANTLDESVYTINKSA